MIYISTNMYQYQFEDFFSKFKHFFITLGDGIQQEPLINPGDTDSAVLDQSKNGSLRNRNIEQPLDSLDEVLNSVDY